MRGGAFMPKYVTIGYGDQAGYERTAQSVRDAAHQHDAQLHADGAVIGSAGKPVQVRNHNGAGTQTSEGAYMQTALPIAGFAIIEAQDVDEAIRLVSETPCAVAYGVVEVWPLDDMPAA
jgi:hypothetical protein